MSHEKPKVSVLIGTYNRPKYLPIALESVENQDMDDWEMLLVNDGGEDVTRIVEDFGDDRIRYFNRDKNRGLGACLNFATERARGKYLAYLGDDDRWYPSHLSRLSNCLDENPHLVGAYSDLYANMFLMSQDGERVPIRKTIDVSRNFNRLFMFMHNHILHVSVMHRKKFVLRAGGYNEDVSVLIDWNMNRKLVFYGDFMRVPTVTGEYFTRPEGTDSDRISDVQRKDKTNYQRNLNRIRADNPPKPWPKAHEVVVFHKPSMWDSNLADLMRAIVENAHYPINIYLLQDQADVGIESCGDVAELFRDFGNVHLWSMPEGETAQGIYAAFDEEIQADYYCVVDSSIEKKMKAVSLATLVRYAEDQKLNVVSWSSEQEEKKANGMLLSSEVFAKLNGSPLEKSWPGVAEVTEGTIPREFMVDRFYSQAKKLESDGDYRRAKKLLERVSKMHKGGIGAAYLAQMYARVSFELEDYSSAVETCEKLVEAGYGAENYVYLGEIYRRQERFGEAIHYYQKAWEERDLTEEHIQSDVFPLVSSTPCQAFTIVMGMAECHLEMGNVSEAAHFARLASRLYINNSRPSMTFGRVFTESGDLERAQQAYESALQVASGKEAAEAYDKLAHIHEEKGDLQQAWDACRAALSAYPGHTDAAERACELADDQIVQEDELQDVLESYLEYHPGNAKVMTRLAEIHENQGRAEEARELMERASLLSNC